MVPSFPVCSQCCCVWIGLNDLEGAWQGSFGVMVKGLVARFLARCLNQLTRSRNHCGSAHRQEFQSGKYVNAHEDAWAEALRQGW